METVSTSARGLDKLVKVAAAQVGRMQKAPYEQGDVDLTDKGAVQTADRERFAFVNGVVSQVEKRRVLTRSRSVDDQIDALLTSKWLGIPVFIVVMFLVFQISQVWVGPYAADTLVALLERLQSAVREAVSGSSDILQALLIDGMIGGVIAARTIRNERERRATVMLAPFMPCGAKIPVISLFAGAFFEDAGWVSTLMYFSGIVLIFLGALLVRRTDREVMCGKECGVCRT